MYDYKIYWGQINVKLSVLYVEISNYLHRQYVGYHYNTSGAKRHLLMWKSTSML